jgi:hypothetical protein
MFTDRRAAFALVPNRHEDHAKELLAAQGRSEPAPLRG